MMAVTALLTGEQSVVSKNPVRIVSSSSNAVSQSVCDRGEMMSTEVIVIPQTENMIAVKRLLCQALNC